ncbi:MAG: Panacea domain-containing protein [Solirubrobacteraceae bacterium]
MATEFDPDRFREAVMYIAWRTRDDARFGRVKLAKALFYADFDAYADGGEVITGARYEHWPFGPFPPILYDVEKQLERSGLAELVGGDFEGDEKKLIAKAEPDTPHLGLWQRAALDVQIKQLAGSASRTVSEKPHEHPAWLVTRHREAIPYAAALLPSTPSPEAMEIARRRSADQGHSAA